MTQVDKMELLTDALGFKPELQHPRSHDDSYRVVASGIVLSEEGEEETALDEALATVSGWEAGRQSHG